MQTVHKDIFTSPAHDWFKDNLDEIRSRTTAILCRLRPEAREEAVAEVMAAVFCAAVRAARRGTLHRVTPFHAVDYALRQYRQGRRVAGTSSTDVCAAATAAKCRVRVLSLDAPEAEADAMVPVTLADTLADRRSEHLPFEKARQNLDYPYILRAEKVGPAAVLAAVGDPRQGVRKPHRPSPERLPRPCLPAQAAIGTCPGQPWLPPGIAPARVTCP